MKRARPALAMLGALAMTVVAACGSGGASAPDDHIEIPAILSLTGGAAFLGTGEQKALTLVQDSVNRKGGINGRQVRFTFLDDKSTPAVAVQLARGLKDDGTPAFLGPSLGSTCSAVAPLLQQGGPVSYCLSPVVHPAKDSFQFSAGVGTEAQFDSLANYMRARKWTRVAYIAASDTTGQDGVKQLNRMMGEQGNSDLSLVATEHYELTDTSVSAQLARIAASRPDVVIVWTSGTSLGTVLNGMRQSGLGVPVITSNANMTFEQMQQYDAFLPSTFLFSVPEWPHYLLDETGPAAAARTDWVATLTEAGVQPDAVLSLAWDPARILLDAYAHGAQDAAGIQDYINGLTSHAGIFGTYDFSRGDQRGLTIDNVILAEWNRDRRVWTPASAARGTGSE